MDGIEQKLGIQLDKMSLELGELKENDEMKREMSAIQFQVKELKQGLKETLQEVAQVEADQMKKEQQENEIKKFEKVEKQGIIDYETGHLRNNKTISRFSPQQLQKIQDLEKNKDPAILHYDLDLLGEIALLFTAASIGGILATVFNGKSK